MATFTVCIPSYNASSVIAATIESLLRQTYADWECLVVDDASTDGTELVVRRFTDERIRFIGNQENVGCAGNFQRCRDLCTGEFLYFLANDDILAPNALEQTLAAFRSDRDVAAVTRPYYWFHGEDTKKAIRRIEPLSSATDTKVRIEDSDAVLCGVLETLGQVSGLAFRNAMLKSRFSPHVWTTHIQPFLETMKSHPIIMLHDYPVAIRLEHSQARTLSSIYDPSPLWTWITMLKLVFPGSAWERQRKAGINNIAKRVEGLVQLRCHSRFKLFLREALLYVRYRPLNVLSPRYVFFALGCAVVPPALLRKAVDSIREATSDPAPLPQKRLEHVP